VGSEWSASRLSHYILQVELTLHILEVPTSNGRIPDKSQTGKDLEGSGNDLIKVLYQHLPGGNEENHVKHQSGSVVSWPRFEPNIS
jgi:hypothetical protein